MPFDVHCICRMAGRDKHARGPASSDSTSESTVDLEDLSPERTFNILSSEIRLSILRALWESPDDSVSFSEIKRYPYVETDNLDYHLRKLVGHFVRRGDGGYSLRYAGEQVMRVMLTGVLTEAPTMERREIDSRCPFCGAPVELQYEDEQLTARCTSCPGVTDEISPEGTFLHYGFPPSGLENRSPDELLEAAHVLYDSKITPMMNGVCPECASTVSHSFDICEEHRADDGLCAACGTRFEVWTEYRCEHCDYRRRCPVWFEVLVEPPVVAFCHEQGDLDESIPFSKLTWRNAPYVRDISTTVLDEDPLLFRVDIPIEDARLSVKLDGSLDILSVSRSTISEPRDGT